VQTKVTKPPKLNTINLFKMPAWYVCVGMRVWTGWRLRQPAASQHRNTRSHNPHTQRVANAVEHCSQAPMQCCANVALWG